MCANVFPPFDLNLMYQDIVAYRSNKTKRNSLIFRHYNLYGLIYMYVHNFI